METTETTRCPYCGEAVAEQDGHLVDSSGTVTCRSSPSRRHAGPDAPLIGQVRTWTDRLDNKRQGRVQSVADGDCTITTANGGVAVIEWSMLDPVDPDVQDEAAAAKARADAAAATRAHAQGWLDNTLPARLQDIVVGAWEARRALNPDGADDDQLKLDAAGDVVAAAEALRDRLRKHVEQKGNPGGTTD